MRSSGERSSARQRCQVACAEGRDHQEPHVFARGSRLLFLWRAGAPTRARALFLSGARAQPARGRRQCATSATPLAAGARRRMLQAVRRGCWATSAHLPAASRRLMAASSERWRRRAGGKEVKRNAAENRASAAGATCVLRERATKEDRVLLGRESAAARARSTRSGARGPSNKIADECLILRSRSRTTRPRWHVSVRGRGTAGDDQHPTNTQTNSLLRGSLGKGRSHRTSSDERDRAQAKRQG
jgi:hypothetical protein